MALKAAIAPILFEKVSQGSATPGKYASEIEIFTFCRGFRTQISHARIAGFECALGMRTKGLRTIFSLAREPRPCPSSLHLTKKLSQENI